MEDAKILLKEILAVKSVNGTDCEGDVAEYICSYFKKHGIQAQVQKIDEKHGNVIAALEGSTEESITWNGHLDTVPYGEISEWNTDPAVPTEKDGAIYARGASDMKSGLAAMVYAMCRMKKTGQTPTRTIHFIGTCDEEKGGLGAVKILEEGLYHPGELLLIGEPTGNQIGIAQKGCLWLELFIDGKTSHGAYPEEGIHAVSHGFDISNRIKAYVESFSHPILKHATAQITQISGGVAPNMTPDRCRILMDIRLVPGVDARLVTEKADQFIRQAEQGCKGQLTIKYEIKNNRMAIETGIGHPEVVKLQEQLTASGKPGEYTGINYFTDASILVKNHKETPVILFGPGEPYMAHKPNEYVKLDSYEAYIDILMRLACSSPVNQQSKKEQLP